MGLAEFLEKLVKVRVFESIKGIGYVNINYNALLFVVPDGMDGFLNQDDVVKYLSFFPMNSYDSHRLSWR